MPQFNQSDHNGTHGVQAGDLERSGLSKHWDENRLAAQRDGGIGPKATTV